MVKLFVKVGLEKQEYDALMRALQSDKFKHLYGGTESGAGRRAFYLLQLEREGRITIHDKKKVWE